MDYNPRDEDRKGRIFEQASKSSSLIVKSLLDIQHEVSPDFKKEDFASPMFVLLICENEEEERSMVLQKTHLDLAHKANGKLGLYLHAYICFTFFKYYAEVVVPQDFSALLETHSELKRLQGLQQTMISFSQKVSKFPFSQQQYEKMVT